jgi:hypothetical protein
MIGGLRHAGVADADQEVMDTLSRDVLRWRVNAQLSCDLIDCTPERRSADTVVHDGYPQALQSMLVYQPFLPQRPSHIGTLRAGWIPDDVTRDVV